MDYTPYTCTAIGGVAGLSGETGTDIEHIVSLAEAHDSGLSAAGLAVFSSDPANLTLATPHENRTVKRGYDAADYLPDNNRCWFAARVIAVKQKWNMSVDGREAQFLKSALAGCTPEQVAQPTCDADAPVTVASQPPPVQSFPNCTAMRTAGWTNGVNRDGGTYQASWDDAEKQTYSLNTARDRDKDGRACEP